MFTRPTGRSIMFFKSLVLGMAVIPVKKSAGEKSDGSVNELIQKEI